MPDESFLNIDELILINQAAQGVVPLANFVTWFESLQLERRMTVMKSLVEMILQARPHIEDGPLAVKSSGL